MTVYQHLARFLWGILHMVFPPQDREWLHAMEAEYIYLPNEREKLIFLFQCVLGAIDIRLSRLCASPHARMSLVFVVALVSVVAGCAAWNTFFPDSLANWFIECNPYFLPFDKLLLWQNVVLFATLFVTALIGYSVWINDYRNLTLLALVPAGVLIFSIVITQNIATSDQTMQAASISVFHWQLFSLLGLFSLNRFLQSKLAKL